MFKPFQASRSQKMLLYRSFLLALLIPFLLAADEPADEAAKKEREKFTGTWKIISAERDGQPDKVSKGAITIYAADGKFSVQFADGTGGAGTYRLDPSKKPTAIDYTPDYGADKGKPHKGIYSLEGDTLKICGS